MHAERIGGFDASAVVRSTTVEEIADELRRRRIVIAADGIGARFDRTGKFHAAERILTEGCRIHRDCQRGIAVFTVARMTAHAVGDDRSGLALALDVRVLDRDGNEIELSCLTEEESQDASDVSDMIGDAVNDSDDLPDGYIEDEDSETDFAKLAEGGFLPDDFFDDDDSYSDDIGDDDII